DPANKINPSDFRTLLDEGRRLALEVIGHLLPGGLPMVVLDDTGEVPPGAPGRRVIVRDPFIAMDERMKNWGAGRRKREAHSLLLGKYLTEDTSVARTLAEHGAAARFAKGRELPEDS